jgi:epoxyqueuosine reductase
MKSIQPPIPAEVIKSLTEQCGVDTLGLVKTKTVHGQNKFRSWLEQGYAGEMTYLSRNLEKRFDSEKLFPGAKSIIVVGLNYFPGNHDKAKQEGPYKVARYAWGEDYHNVLRRKLERLRKELTAQYPEIRGKICVDTAPFMDKFWAQRAGLGWQGKHTNLVSRRFGSWLLIGSLIINFEIDRYDKPETDHCGRCTACLEVCPTGALTAPYQIDATRCISYWTIESKAKEIPEDISKNMNGYIFGCDICIEVCPFNRFQKPLREKELRRRDNTGLLESARVKNLSNERFKEMYSDSPIERPGLDGIRRNIRAASIEDKSEN